MNFAPRAQTLASLLFVMGCSAAKSPNPVAPLPAPTLAEQVDALGEGISFRNATVPDGAQTPEAGAKYVYARTYSANARNSPVGIEVWVFNQNNEPIHAHHTAHLTELYGTIYGWSAEQWAGELAESRDAAAILEEKSDMFWESLSQHLAERVFGESITSALYRFGPQCIDASTPQCNEPGIADAHRVVVRTFLDARRDPMNPVTRSITYIAERDEITNPELFFELQIPNGLRIAGPDQELLDFRPQIAGDQAAIADIRLWAHLPQDRKVRSKNADYPDYNLIFVPLRHLVFQGEVEDPKQPSSGLDYPNREALIQHTEQTIAQLRTAEGGRRIAQQLDPFLNAKYYYMFDAGGQGITGYRDYILGDTAGIGRGLNPDFGRIEVLLNGTHAGTFEEPTP